MARQRFVKQLIQAKTQLIQAQTKQIKEQSNSGIDSFIIGTGISTLFFWFLRS
jgi:hypothetical protein